MKSRTQGTAETWSLDGDTITVFIPMRWKRRGGQKVIIAPDGGDAWVPTKARLDETLIRALARAHRWKRLLEEGKYGSAMEIAEAEKIGRSFVNRLLRLTLLAPDIQEAILEGRQPKGLQLEELTRAMPGAWGEQRQAVACSSTFMLSTSYQHGDGGAYAPIQPAATREGAALSSWPRKRGNGG